MTANSSSDYLHCYYCITNTFQTVRLKTFCPNVTDPWVESPNNVWMSDKGLMSKTPLLPLTKACPHPLKGKLLK